MIANEPIASIDVLAQLTDRANLPSMMMECPRCHFVQPQDRFCANCGLNVDSYHAKPKPLWQRLVANQAAYVVSALVLFAVVAWYVRRVDLVSTAKPGVATPATTPVVGGSTGTTGSIYNSNRPTPPAAATRGEAAKSAAPATLDEASTTPAATDSTNATTPAVSAAGTTAATAPPAAAPTATKPTQVEATFYEISRESWQPLAAEGKSVAEQNSFRILQFAQKDKLVAALVGARRLPGQRQFSTQPSSSLALHFPVGVSGSENAQGLFLDFSVIKWDNDRLEVEVAGHLALRLDPTSEIQARLESMALLPATGALVVLHPLPHKPLPENLASGLSQSPLSVLESPDYLEGQSEMILFISGK